MLWQGRKTLSPSPTWSIYLSKRCSNEGLHTIFFSLVLNISFFWAWNDMIQPVSCDVNLYSIANHRFSHSIPGTAFWLNWSSYSFTFERNVPNFEAIGILYSSWRTTVIYNLHHMTYHWYQPNCSCLFTNLPTGLNCFIQVFCWSKHWLWNVVRTRWNSLSEFVEVMVKTVGWKIEQEYFCYMSPPFCRIFVSNITWRGA